MTITLLYQCIDPKVTHPNVTRNTRCFCR